MSTRICTTPRLHVWRVPIVRLTPPAVAPYRHARARGARSVSSSTTSRIMPSTGARHPKTTNTRRSPGRGVPFPGRFCPARGLRGRLRRPLGPEGPDAHPPPPPGPPEPSGWRLRPPRPRRRRPPAAGNRPSQNPPHSQTPPRRRRQPDPRHPRRGWPESCTLAPPPQTPTRHGPPGWPALTSASSAPRSGAWRPCMPGWRRSSSGTCRVRAQTKTSTNSLASPPSA